LEESLSMSACMPFEPATQALRQLLLVDLPAKTAQRVTDRIGAELEAQPQADVRRAWEQYEFPPRERAAPDTLYLSVDGTAVRLGDEYHKVKVAAFHRTEWRTTARGERELRAVDVTYVVAVAETAEEFAKRVLVEGYRRGWEQARVLVVLGDGAGWIWRHISAQVPEQVQKIEIVDFYHANERLWEVARGVWGEQAAETKPWVEARLEELLQGHVDAVIQALGARWEKTGAARAQLAALGEEKAKDLPKPQKTIREAWTYLTNNRERMHYDQYRQQGLFIGSGTVESACKRLIGARAKQSGMRWSQVGSQAVLQVRALFLSDRDRWDHFWAHRQPPPRHRAQAA
jgi:hypothetical protein